MVVKKKSKKADAQNSKAKEAKILGDLIGDDEPEDKISVSETFAKKFNERKDKEEIARARRILADEDIGSDSSEQSSEDEAADLLTDKVESKIFETLAKIKTKDPSIYDSKRVFFNDDDFTASSSSKAKPASATAKRVSYKDFLRETLLKEGADAIAKEEDELEANVKGSTKKGKSKLKTPAEEQKELRESLVAAANADDEDDDLFSIKQKSADDIKLEDETFEEFSRRKEHRASNSEDMLAQYWKADEDLADTERFLRDYIVNREWLETASLQPSSRKQVPDDDTEEEEEHLEDVDQFEHDYNFRFEVEEGKQIQGHARFQTASVRERNDKRKRQRKEKAERKEADKIRRTEELKRLKNLKRQEIQRRLEKIKEVTGNDEIAFAATQLDGEFDPEAHDNEMQQLLGDDYDERDETLPPEDLTRAPEGLEDDLDVSTAPKEALKRTWGINPDKQQDEELLEDGQENQVEDAEDDADDAEPELWFLCDGCHSGIPGGKRRFDCTVCENFTLCAKCFRIRKHNHKFVRKRVPESAMPPEDLRGHVMEAPEGEGDVQQALDEYFQLDYEDIIGGDLPTRFKYRKVEAKDFGIPLNVLLTKSDKDLNQMVSLKKLRTYRDEGPPEEPRHGWGKGKGNSQSSQAWKNDSNWKGGRSSGTSEALSKSQKKRRRKSEGGSVTSQRLGAYNLHQDKFAHNSGWKPKTKNLQGQKAGKKDES